MAKIWKVSNISEVLNDDELIIKIRKGEIKADDFITCRDMEGWITVKDSIYQFYLSNDALDA